MCPFTLPSQIPGYVTANINSNPSFHYLYLCIALSTNVSIEETSPKAKKNEKLFTPQII